MVSTPTQSRCSTAARDRHEPLAGSAPVATRWLLIEHPGPWLKWPLETPPLAGAVQHAIEAACDANQGRTLLIRRPGRQHPTARRAWCAVDTDRGTWVRGRWSAPEDLLEAADALGALLTASTEAAPELLLVCAHATRDACCALRGRPVATDLARVWPEQVWQCTHLGGHRFAGTLLSLPAGACYGGLDRPDAALVVREARAGRVPATHLRGVTRWSPPEQAAHAWALKQFGPAPLDAARIGSREKVAEGVVRLELLGAPPVPPSTWVEVTTEQLPPARLSCTGTPGAHAAYRVVPLEPDAPSEDATG